MTIPATLPSGLAFPAGTYSLVLKVAGGDAGVDSVVPIPVLTITDSPGAVHLNGSLGGSKIAGTIVAGTASKSGSISFTLTNAGNIPTALYPSVNVAVTLSNGTTTLTLASTNEKLSTLKAVGGKKGATKDTYTVQIPALTAAETAAFPSGTYTVQVTITPIAAAARPALPAITLTGPTITVTGGTTVGGHVWSHGDTITFVSNQQLTGQNFFDRGTFETNLHVTGTYDFSPLGLVLTYDTGGVDEDTFAFTGRRPCWIRRRMARGRRSFFRLIRPMRSCRCRIGAMGRRRLTRNSVDRTFRPCPAGPPPTGHGTRA